MSAGDADPTATFLARLRRCGLLTYEQAAGLAEFVAAGRPDAVGLAKEASRRGLLTGYQIKEVFKGRGAGLTLGPYVLLDLLGEGGMGRVFKAHHARLGRDVAVKIIRPEKLTHPAAETRFRQEVQALAQMSHPNVVTAFDADQIGDTHFYVMEFIDGSDLTKLVRDRGPLPAAEACEYIRQAALGLHHAHQMGLVHRDIKPSNLIVTRSGRQVKVVDLGLARLGDPDPPATGKEADGHKLTQDGFVIGTPDFLAPEQARNPSGVDIRADIYALGGTLYYLLTGQVPFDADTPTEKLVRHFTDPPPALGLLRPDVPPGVGQIIHWCLAKRPDDRPPTPMHLAVALQPFCPAVPTSGLHPLAGQMSGRMAPPPSGAYPLIFPPVRTPPDLERSSQVFKLPPQANADDPIRRRGTPRGRFLVVAGLAGAVVAAAVAAAVLLSPSGGEVGLAGPVAGFTTADGLVLVKLDGGTFRMGSPDGEPGRQPNEGPVHDVTVRGPFLMTAHEVTHKQFCGVTGVVATRPPDLPAVGVTFGEAEEFARRLTDRERAKPYARGGWAFRLPTEAEWEYAARAGKADRPFGVGSGRQLTPRQAAIRATGSDPGEDAPPDEKDKPARAGPERVGSFPPNAFGLFDLHGNAGEWCGDWYFREYPGTTPRTDPAGPADGDRRVVRGGSFRDPASGCRSAARQGIRPGDRRDTVGFRVVYVPAGK